jgi:hypothetical protein
MSARQKMPHFAIREVVKQNLPARLHDGFISEELSNLQLISF